MSFYDALEIAIEEKRQTDFPEVETIITRNLYPAADIFIFLWLNETDGVPAGENTSMPVTQIAHIYIYVKITTQRPEPDATLEAERIGLLVEKVLAQNPYLSSTSYPSGFLKTGRILYSKEWKFPFKIDKYRYHQIDFQGQYFRGDT